MDRLPGGRALWSDCWEGSRRATAELPEQRHPAERAWMRIFELLHRPPPTAISHGRRTPHEADDGCLACGSSVLVVVRDDSKIIVNGGSPETRRF